MKYPRPNQTRMPEPTVYIPASEVMERILERKKGGLPLSKVGHHDPVLARSASKHFGGWRNALKAAGIAVKLPQSWSKQRVVQRIQARYHSGEVLSRTWRQDKPLFRAAVRYFGNWETAMREAGLKPVARERWTKRRVVERLQAYDERVGITNLSATCPRLADAAARLFGGLDAAFEAACVEPSPRRWTDERVIAAIQNRYVAGHQRHVDGLGDLRLANAARRRFGSWQAAVEAAGLTGKITVKKPLRRWSRETVIAEIQNWHRCGRGLTSISKDNQSLYCAGKTWFGSWRAALTAAGFQSSRRVWSKESIIDEIRKRSHEGVSLSSGDTANRNLAAVAYRHFGSWRNAIDAAGVLSCRSQREGR